KVLDANTTALGIYHSPSIPEMQTRFPKILDTGNSQPASLAAIARGETRFSGEFINQTIDGADIYLLLKWLVLPTHEQSFSEVLVVTVDITEQKRYQASLVENELLTNQFRREREHNQLIQQSISALAHDLRTPLSVINTSKDLLLRHFDKLTEEKRREKLESIGRQLEFALELIDDTVERARGAMNERPFHPSAVNLDKLCRVSIEEMRDGGNGRLSFVNKARLEVAWVDDILISRILLNLVGNALKYSPPNAPVLLELDRDASHLILRVTDNGIGIAPEHIPYIFEPFYRVDEDSPAEGTGLGLSIVQECVVRHGGTVDVSSTLGIGTTFTVRLPYHDVAVGVG
ncbi:MAG: HAMP domain-containing histidine kinase, partial [Anaerolineae bacterium]|nr:HAMP domain-containing histidine kinase [Anaerolineae bacterium]